MQTTGAGDDLQSRLCAHLATVLMNWDYRLLELEFRVGLHTRSFVPSVGKERFERVRRAMDMATNAKTDAKTACANSLGVRGARGIRSVHDVFGSGDPSLGVLRREKTLTGTTWDTRWVHKQRLAHFDERIQPPWTLRASTALERVENHEDPGPPAYVRRRERWSYRRGPWTVDLTIASGGGDVDSDESYEIEVELADQDELFRTPLREIVHGGVRLVTDIVKHLGD